MKTKLDYFIAFILISIAAFFITATITHEEPAPKGEVFLPTVNRPQFCVVADADTERWGVEKAMRLWSDPRSNVEFVRAGGCRPDTTPVFVRVEDPGNCKDYAGLHGKHSTHREIVLNDHCNYAQKNRQSVTLHEFGHAAGVKHSEKNDVMFKQVNGVNEIADYLYAQTHG